MFCTKCGTQVADGSLHCTNCGAALEVPAQAAPQNTAPQNTAPQPNNIFQDAPGGSAKPVKVPVVPIVIAVAVIAVIGIICAVVMSIKPTINLNKYVKVEYTGYDTVGKAEFSFDSEAFEKKYKNLKYTSKAKKEAKSLGLFGADIDSVKPYKVFELAVEDQFIGSTQTGLKNGQEITFKWDDIDKRMEEYLNCKVKYSDMTFTVEGLESIQTVDPFENIELDFSGVAPNGSVEITNNNKGYLGDISFYAEPSYGLSNGDTVTVQTYSDLEDLNETMAEKEGKIASSVSKEYKVENLDAYVTKIDEISEDAFEEMKSQANDIITQKTSDWDETKQVLNSAEYMGCYLETAKKQSYSGNNYLFLLYKMDVTYKEDEYNDAKNFTYIFVVRYEDLLVNSDGEVTVDVSDYYTPYTSVRKEVTRGSNHYNTTTYFYGYASKDEFEKKVINGDAASYNSESNNEE